MRGAAGMLRAAHPLRCILKQRLKQAQDAMHGQQKALACLYKQLAFLKQGLAAYKGIKP